jgi:hypothetical protein
MRDDEKGRQDAKGTEGRRPEASAKRPEASAKRPEERPVEQDGYVAAADEGKTAERTEEDDRAGD